MNIPNSITFFRLILALITFKLIISTNLIFFSFLLTIIVIFSDYFDGFFARKLKQSSQIGAWLDIAADRIIEIGYWIVLAYKYEEIVSIWIAIIFLIRGIFVDGIRSFAQNQGYTAFGDTTMMKSPIGRLLVSSNISRFSYAAIKLLAFCSVILSPISSVIGSLAILLVILTTLFCIIRAVPVIIEGYRFFK